MSRTYAIQPCDIKQVTRISYVDGRVDGVNETWERRYHSNEHSEDGTPVLWTRQICNDV